jgi:hypothetical protein
MSRWRKGFFACATSALVAGLVVAGCAVNPRHQALPPAPKSEISSIASTRSPATWFDAAEIVNAFFISDHAVERARIEIAAACLAALSLDAQVYREQANSALLTRPPERGPSGLVPALDPQVAAREGYRHLFQTGPRAGTDDVLDADISEALSPSNSPVVEIEVPNAGIVGAKSQGCIAEANVALFGSIENWLVADQYVSLTVRSLAGSALRSVDVNDAAEIYADCMRTAGFVASNPAVSAQIARERWGDRYQSEEPSREELRMARADAECQDISDIYSLVDKAIVRLAAPWVSENHEVVLKAMRIRKGAGAIAERIMAKNESH